MSSFGGPRSVFQLSAATCAAGNWLAHRALAQRLRPVTSVLWGVHLALVHWTSLRLFPPRTVAPTVHFHLLCLQLVGSFMGIMHHGQIVGMASLGTEPCVRACPGFSVGQASRATGEILGPSDATQASGWHSHLGRRVLSQVPAALQFEPISHVGVVSKYLCTAIPKWRSRQLVGTIRSRGAV